MSRLSRNGDHRTHALPLGPRRLEFEDRLAAALEQARRGEALTEHDLEALMIDPNFDATAYERFRTQAAREGLAPPLETPEGAFDTRVATRAERDLLDIYLDEIGRVAVLGHEELLRLARQARSGDELARKRMILANLKLVVHIARAYRNRGLPMLDVIEEGNLGLIEAVDRFEPERGLRFSTYASIWIRQSMLRGIAEQSRSVRIPVEMFQQMLRYARVERLLRGRLGRPPSHDEVARDLNVSALRAQRLAGLLVGLKSLDEGSALEAYEALSTDDLPEGPVSVERLVERQLEHEYLDRLLRSLTQREEQILRIRYGFHDGVARSLAQTGEHFGITRERVRQIEAKALEKLRQAIEMSEGMTPETTVH